MQDGRSTNEALNALIISNNTRQADLQSQMQKRPLPYQMQQCTRWLSAGKQVCETEAMVANLGLRIRQVPSGEARSGKGWAAS